MINEVKFQTSGAKKIVIEGCQTATGNAFKPISESKGKLLSINLFRTCEQQRYAERVLESKPACPLRDGEVHHRFGLGRLHVGAQHHVQLNLQLIRQVQIALNSNVNFVY